ncbi:hypothetical protein RND81_09G098300 [Saponaria officinalis]|uniref:GAG-pre-integrase domain-containing protein n=1 Tax=Saponaria officinalis TaxID=3572 RepID=A0AAW1IKZ3_SAPOF
MATPNLTSTSVLAPEDPLYIQSSDHPGMKLVSHVFEGQGFDNWKRSMLIALSAKNKLEFIDGTSPKPSTSSSNAKARQRCNDMVFSWILNALSSEIADSVLYYDTAKDVWGELEDRYGQSNGAQLYAVQKKLSDFSQGTDSITTYFTKIKSVWDEIEAMGMNPICSCSCTCGSKTKQLKYLEDQKIFKFLMGLNDSYTVIRGTILMQNPLPKISTVYNNLIQEERQRDIHNSTQFQLDSASFYARNIRGNPNQFQRNPNQFQKNPVHMSDQRKVLPTAVECRYCKKPGHTIEKCYKLQNRKRFAGLVQFNESSGPAGVFAPNQSEPAQDSNIFTGQDNSTVASANFAGNSYSSISSNVMHNTWILDSGSTDHMCANRSLFSCLKNISKPYTISLPNGQIVTINSVGTVPITSDIILSDVLYVPCFKFNLLSVAKLARHYNSTITSTSDACFMQGSSLKKPLMLGRNNRDLFLMQSDVSLTKTSANNKDHVASSSHLASVSTDNTALWHNRLGHLPMYKLRLLDVFNASSASNASDINACYICAKSRQHRLSFPNSFTSTFSAFELIHIDV